MKARTLAEHFQPARIERYPVLVYFMQLDKRLFKSKVPKLSRCIHNGELAIAGKSMTGAI